MDVVANRQVSRSPVPSARPPPCLTLGMGLKEGPSRPKEGRGPPVCILGAGSKVTPVADTRGNSAGSDSPGPSWVGRFSEEPRVHS